MAAEAASNSMKKVAVIGSGLIGRSYAMLFASGGYRVELYDVDSQQVVKAKADIEAQLVTLEKQGLLHGALSREEQFNLITGVTDLESCVRGAFFVQECVPERLDIKREVWGRVDALVSGDVILSSSTSALLPSAISEGLTHRQRFVISHPTNPPFYAPLVEIIPAPWTDPDVVSSTHELLASVGLVPVLVKKEVIGFVLNRIQSAILGEAWRLIRDDVMSAADLDKVMTCGLGARYAFIGPFETCYLNAEGMHSYRDRYSDTILSIQQDQGAPERMEGPVLERIQQEMEGVAGPVEDLQKRRHWRDRRLASLAKLKADMDKADGELQQ